MTTALLLCNQPENYLRKPYFASFDVKKKFPLTAVVQKQEGADTRKKII